MQDHLPILIIIASFVLTAAGMLVKVTWQISRVAGELKEEIVKAKDEVEARQDSLARSFGENVSAVRQKVHEVEIWARDMFVRRDAFGSAIADVKVSLNEMGARIEKRLDRMDRKFSSPSHDQE